MPKKKSIFEDEENESEEKEEKSMFDDSIFETKSKKTKGKVINITLTKVFIEYGAGLGTFVIFESSKHSNLKIGDPIEF